jgi:hypothetical protein
MKMNDFNYEKFSDERWVFNANKYTKQKALTLWLIEITKDLKNVEDTLYIKPKQPYKFFAKYFDEVPEYVDIDSDTGCYALSAQAGFRELEKDEFEVWVFPSIQDLKNGTWGI